MQILQVWIRECLKPVRLAKMATSHPKSKHIMREKNLRKKRFEAQLSSQIDNTFQIFFGCGSCIKFEQKFNI